MPPISRTIAMLFLLQSVLTWAYGQSGLQEYLPFDIAPNDSFAWSIDVDGQNVIAGSYQDDDAGPGSGSAYIYRQDSTALVFEAKITAADAAAGDGFGFSVGICGGRAVVGAWNDDGGRGSLYIFENGPGGWQQTAKLQASDGAPIDHLGFSVAIDSNYVVSGAYLDDPHGSFSGSAYIFWYDGSNWVEQQKLTASNGATGDLYGYSVALDGNTALVGSWSHDTGGQVDRGAVYAYQRSGTVWSEQAIITSLDGTTGDIFGWSVALDQDRAVIGAPGDDDGASNAGSAYVFERSGTVWNQVSKLTASDGAEDDFFGTSVDVRGGMILIGADFDDDMGTNSGSAYTFFFDAAGPADDFPWIETGKFVADDGDPFGEFGWVTKVSPNGAFYIGSYGHDHNGVDDTGALYVVFPLPRILATGPVDFGNVPVGQTWPEDAHLVNNSPVTVSVGPITIGGVDAANFNVEFPTPFLLQPGEAVEIPVEFTPLSIGEFDATLKIASSILDIDVGLHGNGISPEILFQPDPVTFDPIEEFRISPQPGQLINGSPVDVTVRRITIGGEDPTSFNVEFPTPVLVPPGQSAGMTIIFTPDTEGQHQGTLFIGTDQQNFTVDLSGTATPSPVGTEPFPGPGGTLPPGSLFGEELYMDEFTSFRSVVGRSGADNNLGAIDIYDRNPGAGFTFDRTLRDPGGTPGSRQGASLAGHREMLVVGAPGDNTNGQDAGAVRIWDLTTFDGVTLRPQSGAAGDRFGTGVALNNDLAVVGAPGADGGVGRIHPFRYVGGVWDEEPPIVAPVIPGESVHSFAEGTTIPLTVEAEDHVLVASVAFLSGTLFASTVDSSVVFVFSRNAGVWELEATLSASDGRAGDGFGRALSGYRNFLLVGAPGHQDSSGAAYLFRRDTTLSTDHTPTWTEVAKLRAPDAFAGDRFGSKVHLRRNRAAVGAPGDDDGRGAAYVFRLDSLAALQNSILYEAEYKFTRPGRAANDLFGQSVLLSDSLLLAGAPGQDSAAGGAYSFEGLQPITGLPAASSPVPLSFRLEQNYPNPFNPSTAIQFWLPAAQVVKLSIFNLLGQKIRTLVDGKVAAGRQELLWDGRDDQGRQVSSGVYIYRLQAGGQFTRSRKMVLLR